MRSPKGRKRFMKIPMRLPLSGVGAGTLLVLLISVSALGCQKSGTGKPTARLQGRVTIMGEAPPTDAEASLTFKPMVRGQANTTTCKIVDGSYDARDVPVGKVKVYFNIQQPTGKMISEGGGRPFPEYRNLVPPQLGSGMEIEVAGGESTRDFKL